MWYHFLIEPVKPTEPVSTCKNEFNDRYCEVNKSKCTYPFQKKNCKKTCQLCGKYYHESIKFWPVTNFAIFHCWPNNAFISYYFVSRLTSNLAIQTGSYIVWQWIITTMFVLFVSILPNYMKKKMILKCQNSKNQKKISFIFTILIFSYLTMFHNATILNYVSSIFIVAVNDVGYF